MLRNDDVAALSEKMITKVSASEKILFLDGRHQTYVNPVDKSQVLNLKLTTNVFRHSKQTYADLVT